MESLKKENPIKSKRLKWLQDEHHRSFIKWLKHKVMIFLHIASYLHLCNAKNNFELACMQIGMELQKENHNISEYLRWLSYGPRYEVLKYHSYVINGCRFQTKERDDSRVTQNSGVSLVAQTMQVSSSKDKNPVYSDMLFYGVLQDIWELDYNKFKIAVFKCDWVENSTGLRRDELGFTLVDLKRIGHKNDSFILASHAKQVFYVDDPIDTRWSIVLSTPNKDFDDVDELGDTSLEHESFSKSVPVLDINDMINDDVLDYVRSDCEGTWVEDVPNV